MGKELSLQLPVSRVRLIMKSSPDVENIGQDALHLVTRATELFIQHLAQNAHKKNPSNSLEYKQLAEVVQTSENMTFLRGMPEVTCTSLGIGLTMSLTHLLLNYKSNSYEQSILLLTKLLQRIHSSFQKRSKSDFKHFPTQANSNQNDDGSDEKSLVGKNYAKED